MKSRQSQLIVPKRDRDFNMKILVKGFLLLWVSMLMVGIAPADQGAERPDKHLRTIHLLPVDDEISGWKRSEKVLRASKEEDFYRLFNGGAVLYIKHGVQFFVGQDYRGPNRLDLEVYIFYQGSSQNAQSLYEDPFNKPTQGQEIADVGEKARTDESAVFCYGVEFIQEGFFVRVIIQDRTKEGLDVALKFARTIANRIK
jgi:hypothetical protein